MLGVYRALCVINMILFILCFLVLMNRKCYEHKLKINSSLIVILILSIMFTMIGIPFGVVKLPILIQAIFLLFLICKVLYKRSTRESIITSLIYSLVYVLIQCSLYWFLTIKF
ncbi:MAG: ATP-binding protein, partial [Terrisporobacter sp.]